jgi:3-(methylthio)propanoyl-CoA dehydrogenase
MSAYRAPLRDMQFALRELAGIDGVAALPGCEEALDVLDAVLEEAAAFAAGVLDPLNRSGDKEGCTWEAGTVTTPRGFKEAYKKFADAGWIGLPVPAEYGGQGLPQIVLGPALEMWNAANIGFANGPLLNQGAIEAIELVGSAEQKARFIPNLVSGKWTGTMCLTEPQAGSDLAQVRARAVADGDRYRITGTKIFITFGEHDMAENIIHLVLARLPDAPEGTKGISLFIVPKVLVNDDGSLGERNDVVCAGIEHKLGINANPTCTLNYGEAGRGAVGYLVGEPNRGLEYMFIMMNAARFSVGVQGIALADRAYQSALEYAKERVQGRELKPGSRTPEPIVKHPDVRRMLMQQKATIEAMRALAYVTAASMDYAQRHPDERVRKEHKAFVELMIPVVKGWCTESAVDLCSIALQIFGGTGYIEETGIAQQYRDVRIITIYEGTTGIQSLDLIGRKLLRDMGATATAVGKRMESVAKACAAHADPSVKRIGEALGRGLAVLNETSQWIGMNAMGDLNKAFACSVPYLRLWGTVAGGWQMARAAQIAADKISAGDSEADFYRAKLATAAFYASHVLTQAAWLGRQIVDGSGDVMALSESQFELDRKLTAGVSR